MNSMTTNKLSRPAAILYDLDGTLMDTAADFFPTVNELRAEHQLDALPHAVIRAQVSNGGRALTRLALNMEFDEPDFEQKRDRLLELYTHHLGSDSTLFPGMESLLSTSNELAIPWGIVTNKPRLYTELLLARLEAKLPILKSCAVVICPDDVKQSKPDPEPLFLAANKLSVQTEQCWYVGDHIRDIEAGSAAKMTTFAATFGYIEEGDNINDWQADHIIHHSNDLTALLKNTL